jgi:hypothetical protein
MRWGRPAGGGIHYDQPATANVLDSPPLSFVCYGDTKSRWARLDADGRGDPALRSCHRSLHGGGVTGTGGVSRTPEPSDRCAALGNDGGAGRVWSTAVQPWHDGSWHARSGSGATAPAPNRDEGQARAL